MLPSWFPWSTGQHSQAKSTMISKVLISDNRWHFLLANAAQLHFKPLSREFSGTNIEPLVTIPSRMIKKWGVLQLDGILFANGKCFGTFCFEKCHDLKRFDFGKPMDLFALNAGPVDHHCISWSTGSAFKAKASNFFQNVFLFFHNLCIFDWNWKFDDIICSLLVISATIDVNLSARKMEEFSKNIFCKMIWIVGDCPKMFVGHQGSV